MRNPRGGRHRDPAERRRRMFFAIILAFGLSTVATSLWALGSPLDGTAYTGEERAAEREADSSEPAETLAELRIGDPSVQPQDPEETSASPSPEAEETTEKPEPSDDPEPEPEPDLTEELAVFELVNQRRSEAGCGSLESNDLLDTAARLHAEDMAVNDYFDHTSLDGRSPTDRAAEQGYQGGVGENIAKGFPDADSVMEGWMNSDGHRANILNCDYRYLGVGIADSGGTLYWVQNFG